jgi:predicted alpha/beta hydrolase family esterase
MRYLQELPEENKVGGFISVAGFFSLPNLETQEERDMTKPWFESPLYLDKIKKLTNKVVAIFSDNDEHVSVEENSRTFKEKLGAEIIVEHNKGHFGDSAGIKELPIVLKKLLEISK